MTIYFNAFVGSWRPIENLLSTKNQQVAPSGCGVSRSRCSPLHHPSHTPRHGNFPLKTQRPSIALEKRSRQYFFKLLSAARQRDKRMLVSAMKSLGADKEYLHQLRSADPELADPSNVQDVLLKAASRCGQVTLADRLYTVRTGMRALLISIVLNFM